MSQSEVQAVNSDATEHVGKNSSTEENGIGVQLTNRQVELISETWALVRVDLEKAGMVMFFKLFEIAPELQELFPFKGEELESDNASLKKHALQVMESIDAAIGMLSNPEELKETLIELGIIHHMKDVQLDSFAPVGQALIFALETGLQEKFTDEVKTAWVTLYTIVQQLMTLGMNEGIDA